MAALGHYSSMLGHEYEDMPGRSKEVGDNPHETTMLMRCKWCMSTPAKARQDGCHVRERQEMGSIVLREWNPDGMVRFADRLCATCERPIMGHMLRKGSELYWCHANQNQFSDGIAETVWDVPEGFGKDSL